MSSLIEEQTNLQSEIIVSPQKYHKTANNTMSKVWLVTGSSRGLGRAIVEKVLSAGHTVIATARNPSSLSDLVSKYGSDKVLTLAVDVTKEDQVNAAVKQGHKKFGRIDVVVNNAGYANLVSVEDISISDFETQMNTNFMGVVYVTKAVLPILRTQGSGHIFQISSLGGRIGAPGLSAYQSAKWAVGGFSTVLSQEVAPLGIKVTVLEPGGVRTDWAGSSMEVPQTSEPYQQTVGKMGEMLRNMTGTEPSLPEKIADIMLGLEGREDAPLRLLVGPDAVEYAKAAAKVLADRDEKWKDVSVSSI